MSKITKTNLTKKSKHAFSLVELSIVLIIIGLLAAAFTGGNKLVASSKAQKLFHITKAISTAFNFFELRYNGFPGDITNAENFWGTYHSSTNPNGTKNGNGDGHINDWLVSGERESLRAWQQLYKSGNFKTPYTGIQNTSSDGKNDLVGGQNVPKTPYEEVIIDFVNSSNILQIGKGIARGGSLETVELRAFSNKFLYRFDKKYDDGLISKGAIRKGVSRNDDDTSWASNECLNYDNLSDEIKCAIKFYPAEQ